MKGIVKTVIAIVVVSVTVIIGVNVAGNIIDSPRKTIERFEDSYNALDIDGVIECFEPSVQAIYSGANSLLGEFVGMNISDLAAIAPFIAEYDEDGDISDFPKMSIDINDIDKTSDSTAVVYCDISYSTGMSDTDQAINMVKIDGEWYISAEALY